jgi:hypothetical protein
VGFLSADGDTIAYFARRVDKIVTDKMSIWTRLEVMNVLIHKAK